MSKIKVAYFLWDMVYNDDIVLWTYHNSYKK